MENNILERLLHWVTIQPNKPAWTFLNDKSEPNDSYTYLELDRITTALASWLIDEAKINIGDRALLVFFPGLHFMISLLACFKAGIIAVPVFPPDPRRQKKDLHHFISIQSSSGASVALSHNLYNFAKKVSDIKNIFSTQSDQQWPEIRWINVDSIISKAKSSTYTHRSQNLFSITSFNSINPDTVAFLQYTSGSTSEPKGVMITHRNLIHNEVSIAKELKTTNETVCVSWLPQYHDMGLIGSYLGCLFCGGSGYYLSPISFLKDPTQWIRAMSNFRATHTQAPNFAYALVTRKFLELSPQPTNIDLSSLQHMINAAEPVDCFALQHFRLIFSKYNLSPSIIYPTYGLAEHTVFVCSGGRQILYITKSSLEGRRVEVLADYQHYDEVPSLEQQSSSLATNDKVIDIHRNMLIVGCGYPHRVDDVVLKIVDPDTGLILQEDDMIGEIWINSPSKALGYWNRPEISQHDFHARPTEYAGSDTFLRTGDLGFLHRDELFICGRLKDLIIVRGSNHYPQDIERTAEVNNPLIRPGCSAAFSINFKESEQRNENGETIEAVVYIAEVRDEVTSQTQLQNIIETCQRVISTDHGISLHAIVLLKSRTIPKTTSGKIARSWCRRAYLENKLQIVKSYVNTDINQIQRKNNNEDILSDGMEIEGSNVIETTESNNNKNNSNNNKNYQLVSTLDQHNNNNSNSNNNGEIKAIPLGDDEHDNMIEMKSVQYTREELRNMELSKIELLLEEKLIQIVKSQGGNNLVPPLNKNQHLAAYGLDSMLITQYKGVLENRFHCEFPDEFMFTKKATISELSQVVKNGKLTEAQEKYLETIEPEEEKNNDNPDENNDTVVIDNPICPWFTCCY